MTRRWHVERSHEQGFTLIEMMVVVVIVGVLATLGISGYQRYIRSSRTAEAGEMINQIRAGQEAYRTDAFTYLDISGTKSLADMSTFYPNPSPGNFKTAWGSTSGAVGQRWSSLNMQPDGGGLYFAYGCAAGESTDPVPGVNTSTPGNAAVVTVGNWPTTVGSAWYVVKAIGDLDGDGKDYTEYVTGSFTTQVYFGNEFN